MPSIFARALRYQSLTPGERALLRLLEGAFYVALIGAATAGVQYLASPIGAGVGAINWAIVARVCAAGAAVALLMTLSKYFRAHGDPTLADALDTVSTRIRAEAGAPPPAPSPLPSAAPPTRPIGGSTGRALS